MLQLRRKHFYQCRVAQASAVAGRSPRRPGARTRAPPPPPHPGKLTHADADRARHQPDLLRQPLRHRQDRLFPEHGLQTHPGSSGGRGRPAPICSGRMWITTGSTRFFERMEHAAVRGRLSSPTTLPTRRVLEMADTFANENVTPIMTKEEWKVLKGYCAEK